MAAPLILKIIVFSVAKKVTVFLIAKIYGFPRAYRRMAELNRYLNQNNLATRQFVNKGMQFMFRLPRNILSTFRRWRSVSEPSHKSPSSSGHSPGASSSSSSSPPQQHQVRQFHTASRHSQAHISSYARSFSGLQGLFVVNQSMRSHLLGQRREKPHPNFLRQWSSLNNALPFGTEVFPVRADLAGRKHDRNRENTCSLECMTRLACPAVVCSKFPADNVTKISSSFCQTGVLDYDDLITPWMLFGRIDSSMSPVALCSSHTLASKSVGLKLLTS